MKKIIALILALTMMVSMAACAKEPAEDGSENESITEDNTQNNTTDGTTEDETTEDDTNDTDVNEPATPDEDVNEPANPDEDVNEPANPDAGETTNPDDGETAGNSAEEQEVLDTLAKLVDGAADEIMCDNIIISADQYPYYLFIDYIDGAIAGSSSAMIGSIAHSVVLLKLPEDADVAAVAADIEENMDPRKWICVEAEATLVKTSGQYVLMAMSSQAAVDTISANFDTVFGA